VSIRAIDWRSTPLRAGLPSSSSSRGIPRCTSILSHLSVRALNSGPVSESGSRVPILSMTSGALTSLMLQLSLGPTMRSTLAESLYRFRTDSPARAEPSR
jgi:hypothetical protein